MRLEDPVARRAPVGRGDVIGSVADGVAEAVQDVVEGGRRLVPAGLLGLEGFGRAWHRFITRRASPEFEEAAVALEEVRRSLLLLFRGTGGELYVPIVPIA